MWSEITRYNHRGHCIALKQYKNTLKFLLCHSNSKPCGFILQSFLGQIQTNLYYISRGIETICSE